MKFLVTGGRGFIGSHFVEKCLDEGHKVIDIDSMTYAANTNLPFDNSERYEHIEKDIRTITHLPTCDVLINFAAESHVDNSINEPDVFAQTNIIGTQNLLNLVRGKTYGRPLFVHISTDEVYGSLDEQASFQKAFHIIQDHPILLQRRLVTIWLIPGITHMGYQLL